MPDNYGMDEGQEMVSVPKAEWENRTAYNQSQDALAQREAELSQLAEEMQEVMSMLQQQAQGMNQQQAEPAKEIPMQNAQQQSSPDVLSGLAQSLGMRPEEFTQLIGTLKQTPQMLNMLAMDKVANAWDKDRQSFAQAYPEVFAEGDALVQKLNRGEINQKQFDAAFNNTMFGKAVAQQAELGKVLNPLTKAPYTLIDAYHIIMGPQMMEQLKGYQEMDRKRRAALGVETGMSSRPGYVKPATDEEADAQTREIGLRRGLS